MSKYLLIESQDPFTTKGSPRHYETAQQLALAGHDVVLFLVENGVLPARRCSATAQLESLQKQGIKILADDFSLKERGITANRRAACVEDAPISTIVDEMAAGRKTIWH